MSELTPDEAHELLARPRTIYAPDGAKFTMTVDMEANLEQLNHFGSGAIFYHVVGPRGTDKQHTWIGDHMATLTSDPLDPPPKLDTVRAELAFGGWLMLSEHYAPG